MDNARTRRKSANKDTVTFAIITSTNTSRGFDSLCRSNFSFTPPNINFTDRVIINAAYASSIAMPRCRDNAPTDCNIANRITTPTPNTSTIKATHSSYRTTTDNDISALTHDIGKLFVTEIITTYDRKLFDEEFQMIRSHPVIGAYVLSKHEGTKDYVNTAKYHHLYYDGSQGYPLEDISHLPERVFIEILACADCLDAATDSVGRSYKEGKSLEEFLQEIKEGSGTRYAPYVVDLFNEEKVLCRIQKTLLIGRDENYQKTYHLLKD